MEKHTSRRSLFKASGALVATSLLGGGLVACGGGRSGADQPLEWTAVEAINAIKEGRMSAEAYVMMVIDRAETQKDLNSLIVLDKAGALTAARHVDAMRKAGKPLPVLAGLPIVVKDNINTSHLPTTGGTPALRNVQPTTNAPSLQKLIDAGAIVLGKANMHELAFGVTSTNLAPFAGPVKNPYDKTRIAGGSSGGTAAAIAARIAPAGLGTDTGGSTRVPAALCGIAGLRPSVGNGGAERRYTDTHAVVPISHTRDTVGPMGRTVADLELLDAVITGRASVTAVELRGVRIGIPTAFWEGLDTEVARVMSEAKEKLIRAGVVFVEVDTTGLWELNNKVSFQIALHEPIDDIPAYLAATGVTGISVTDIATQVASPDVKGAFGAILADAFGAAYPDAINVHRPAMQALYKGYFNANSLDALMFPTTILPAVPIDLVNGSSQVSVNSGTPQDEFSTYIRNTDAGSNAGIPGLSLPAGLTTHGLPVGLEIDGPLGSDNKLLAIGMAIEKVLGTLPAPAV